MSKSYYGRECMVCGGRTSNAGFARSAHEHGKRHIAALKQQGYGSNGIMVRKLEADNADKAQRRKTRRTR